MTTLQKIKVVEDYIFHRKEKKVSIGIGNNMPELFKLEQAYQYAMNWFAINKVN